MLEKCGDISQHMAAGHIEPALVILANKQVVTGDVGAGGATVAMGRARAQEIAPFKLELLSRFNRYYSECNESMKYIACLAPSVSVATSLPTCTAVE